MTIIKVYIIMFNIETLIMIEEASEYYKRKGFEKVYINTNKEPRRVATLRTPDGKMTSMSYAKYLYTSYYNCDILEGEQIDHINGDKMDDRIENLQKKFPENIIILKTEKVKLW